ncbi:hypothetical protein HC928_09105, partial [bacterium]|nr:hypothetical protein [bacterium]
TPKEETPTPKKPWQWLQLRFARIEEEDDYERIFTTHAELHRNEPFLHEFFVKGMLLDGFHRQFDLLDLLGKKKSVFIFGPQGIGKSHHAAELRWLVKSKDSQSILLIDISIDEFPPTTKALSDILVQKTRKKANIAEQQPPNSSFNDCWKWLQEQVSHLDYKEIVVLLDVSSYDAKSEVGSALHILIGICNRIQQFRTIVFCIIIMTQMR